MPNQTFTSNINGLEPPILGGWGQKTAINLQPTQSKTTTNQTYNHDNLYNYIIPSPTTAKASLSVLPIRVGAGFVSACDCSMADAVRCAFSFQIIAFGSSRQLNVQRIDFGLQ